MSYFFVLSLVGMVFLFSISIMFSVPPHRHHPKKKKKKKKGRKRKRIGT